MLSIYDISSDLCKIALSGMKEFCLYGKVGSLVRKFITWMEEEKEDSKKGVNQMTKYFGNM